MLRKVLFFNLLRACVISACIMSAYCNYSQNEIDIAFKKMKKRERYYLSLDNQTGCWPNNVIPFIIDSAFSQEQVQHIQDRIYQIQNKTCVRWVEVNTTNGYRKYVKFEYSTDINKDCSTGEYFSSSSSSQNNPLITTKVFLRDRCFPTESVIHEMLHALGLSHEHQRLDRDCYVDVDEDHAKYDSNFKIIYDLFYERWPYDKRSVLHYTRLTGLLKDKDKPQAGFVDQDCLWDSSGCLRDENTFYEEMSYLDTCKLNFRFCGAPDLCDTQPRMCEQIEEDEKSIGCKQIYEDIANGLVKPS